jgi:quercetin dioxygenase-like cupin family protein
MVVKPYTDKSLAKGVIRRVFTNSVDTDELVWHRDHNTRQVKVVEGADWQIQFDNELPKTLSENESVHIPANTYHRIIKGSTDLVLEIKEEK